jgi:hypothetical protein
VTVASGRTVRLANGGTVNGNGYRVGGVALTAGLSAVDRSYVQWVNTISALRDKGLLE